MSAPDPASVKVPLLSLALPAAPTEPTSAVDHPLGSEDGGGGGGPPPVIVALSKVARAVVMLTWLLITNPASTVPVMDTESRPTSVHVVPSSDMAAISVPLDRVTLTHFGAVPVACVLRLVPPLASRR